MKQQEVSVAVPDPPAPAPRLTPDPGPRPQDPAVDTSRVGRWYFGGVASAMAASCTHPLDLLKVHLQTQQQGKVGLIQMGLRVVRSDGILGLYNGLSASLVRQLTYSMTRFAIYETVKDRVAEPGQPMPFYQKVLLGGFAGAVGGVAGTPGDMVNVSYKHAFDGLYQVFRHEGPRALMSGATMASARATLVTIGQLSCYDQFKQLLLMTPIFTDNIITHFTASFCAGGVATLITMPLDVMKTRLMNAPKGKYSGIFDCAKDVGKNGPLGFFKGLFPAFVRLGPQTVLTFIFFEQLRVRYGKPPKTPVSASPS